ncbi:hypothetical protein ACFLSZ_03035 [Candidatus Bipolaricaulota bacterium]
MRRTQATRIRTGVTSLIVGLLLAGCGRAQAPVDQTAEWLETAEQVLSDAIMGYFTSPVYETGWDLENAESTLDEERFPAWARDRYDVCIHWKVPFWTEVYNSDRRPGNSSVFVQQPGEGWGWILVGDRGTYILELGYQLIDDDVEPVVLINVWDFPG